MKSALDALLFALAAIGFFLVMIGVGPGSAQPAPYTWGRFNLLGAGLLMFDLPFLIAAWPGH